MLCRRKCKSKRSICAKNWWSLLALKLGTFAILVLASSMSEGAIWGPKSALFCMLLAHMCRNVPPWSCIVACSAFEDLAVAIQLENGTLRHTCLISDGVHPTFHSHISISYHPLAQIGWFFVIWSPGNKYHRKIIEVKKRSGWSDVQFQPFQF